MTKMFKISHDVVLPESCRLTSGARGYEGHCMSRAQVAGVLAKATGMGYRAAYRETCVTGLNLGGLWIVRGSIGAHRGWIAFQR